MSSNSNRTARAALCLMIAAVACSSGSGPRLTAPASIIVQNVPPTMATVGANITPVPAFVVKDSGGHPLANVSVSFFTTPGATVTPTTVATDANGVARPSAWLLGTHAGNMVLTASIASPPVNTSVTVVAQPGPAASLQVPPSASLGLTDTVAVAGVAYDSYGNALPATTLNLSSSNTAVATVSGSKIIAQAPGTATVTVSVPGTALSKTVSVTVFERFGHLTGRPFGIAYAPGSPGKILVSSLDVNAVSFVNGSTFAVGSLVATSATPSDVFVNSAGSTGYVSAVDGGSVTVINVTSATGSGVIPDPGSARVLLSPDGSKLYVGKNGGLDVYAMPAGTLTASLPLGTQVNGLAISSDGSVLYASERFSGKVWRFNTSTMTATDSIATGGAAQDIAFHEASGNVYVANEGGWVDVLSAAHLASLSRINNIFGAFALRLNADGSKLFVAGSQAGNVYIIDRASGTVTSTVNVGGTPRRIAFLPDGRALVANEAGYVSLVH